MMEYCSVQKVESLTILTEVKVFPVPIYDGEQEKLVSVTISNRGIETTEISPPFHTRGVIILITFLSETESQCWEAEFQFHKGNTLIETRMVEKEETKEETNEYYGEFCYLERLSN